MQEEEVDKGSDSGDMQMDTGALMLEMAGSKVPEVGRE